MLSINTVSDNIKLVATSSRRQIYSSSWPNNWDRKQIFKGFWEADNVWAILNSEGEDHFKGSATEQIPIDNIVSGRGYKAYPTCESGWDGQKWLKSSDPTNK